MSLAPHVAVVGSLHYDIMVRAPYLPRTGETLIGESWWWKSGGKGGNQGAGLGNPGFFQQFRQYMQAFVVHEAQRPGKLTGIGTTVTQAAENQGAAAGGCCQVLGKIMPHVHTPQALV